ncbi:MAG: molybdopterin molybdotransferase MoeA [Thermodesulfovibrionales bacterium]|nr:molybdopterin molybdotransferase MoeA [Thermodesulfovibrionales bacterium]
MRDMLGREEVITVEKALEFILKNLSAVFPPEIKLNIEHSCGRILSRDIFSPENLPQFARSTVDGFAVTSSDTFGASDGLPAYLNIAGEVLMGAMPDFELKKGMTAKIATGGMLPEGADAVVMIEHAQTIDEKMVEVMKPAAPGENVIQAGEDVKKGALVLKRGHRLRPQDTGALAGLGITEVYVYEKPKVSIISTGNEIVPANSDVKPGQVRDINSFNLAGLISEAGGEPVKRGIFSDEYSVIKKVVEESLEDSAMALITGGSSVGTKDMTAKIINDVGSPGVLFHGVSIKPGKPLIGGIINNKPVFGLPGHPAAITVCFEQFIEPVLKKLTGISENRFRGRKLTVTAKMAKNIASSSGREDHIRVALEARGDEIWANPILGKSGLITTLVKADGIVVIPLRKLGVEQGEVVEVRLF